jgi:hypothetical protein
MVTDSYSSLNIDSWVDKTLPLYHYEFSLFISVTSRLNFPVEKIRRNERRDIFLL